MLRTLFRIGEQFLANRRAVFVALAIGAVALCLVDRRERSRDVGLHIADRFAQRRHQRGHAFKFAHVLGVEQRDQLPNELARANA